MLLIADAPAWWATVLTALVGGVAAALIVQFFTLYGDWRNTRRERIAGERAHRLEALEGLLTVGHTAFLSDEPRTVQIDREMLAAMFRTQLILSGDVQEKAKRYYMALLEWRPEHSGNQEAAEKAGKAVLRAEDELITAARKTYKELGIPKPTSP